MTPAPQSPGHNRRNAAPKKLNPFLWIYGFYLKYFPTDSHTYIIRLPFIGFIFSLLSYDFVTIFLQTQFVESSTLFTLSYILLSAGTEIQFHYGLRIDDKKQFVHLLILKLVEIGFITVIIFLIFIKCYLISELEYYSGSLVLGFFLLALNIAFYIVLVMNYMDNGHSASSPSTQHPCAVNPEIVEEVIYGNVSGYVLHNSSQRGLASN